MDLIHVLCLVFFHTILVNAINVCQTGSSCRECISLNPGCGWCEIAAYISPTTNRYYKKCDLVTAHQIQGCKKIHNPTSETLITEDATLSGDTRVKPKKVTTKLRPGQAAEIKVYVKTPRNFPIDLYILMDLSRSMADDLKQVVGLADTLTTEMNRVSSNFKLGFGGFIDKPIAPYTLPSTEVKSMGDMPFTFSYKNFQRLTQNTTEFKETVNRDVKASFNVDAPEGSLEALMQVIQCRDQIGWRDKRKARRLVILTTDQLIHLAGDGLMVGSVIPNDGNCHLTANNQYSAYNKFDYPSLSQVREAVIDSQIVPIFAVLGHQHLYDDVASFFGLASGAVSDRLANDSSNIVPIVRNAYEKIARTVNIKSAAPTGIEVKFFTNCGKKDEPIVEKSLCDGIELGQEIFFKATVLANDCDADTSFQIKTDFDDVDVNLEMMCECPCEQIKVPNSPSCTGRGTLSCGLCDCNDGFAGRLCQCTAEQAANKTLCLKDGMVCNDRGTCECGECKCDPITYNDAGEYEYIYGDQCECTNTSCLRSNGLICGGPDHGVCDCGTCQCLEGWTGDACEQSCPWQQNNCADESMVMCSGHGTCKCNKCVCEDGYGGDYCQRCYYNCPDPCEDFKDCAKCLAFDSSTLTQEECHALCRSLNISLDFRLVDMIDKDERCIVRDEDDCSIIFNNDKQFHHDHDHVLIIRREKFCPAEADSMAIIMGIIAAIVGIGLILLVIWRILFYLQDRKEFAKLNKEQKNPQWDTLENPIYVKATSTFENPTYGGQDPPSSPTPSTFNPAKFEGTVTSVGVTVNITK